MVTQTGGSGGRLGYLITLLVGCCMLPWTSWAAGGVTHMQMGMRAWRDYIGPETELMLPGITTLMMPNDPAPAARFGCYLPGMGDNGVLPSGRLSPNAIKEAFYSGCYFPDWGYPTPGTGGASETSHWRPFQETYLAMLKQYFPLPWDDYARRHIAFFLGTIVHGTTDVPWHFTYNDCVALESAVEQADAGCTNVDARMDFCTSARFRLDIPMAGRAWWPLDILQETLAASGEQVSREQIIRGCSLLQVASGAEEALGFLVNLRYRKSCEWGRAHYEDYYYGGINHGAAMTSSWIKYFYARLNGWAYYQNQLLSGWPPSDSYRPYQGTSDTHIMSQQPDANAGAEPFIEAGRSGEDERAVLIRFDLEDWAAGAVPRQAKLWLYTAGARDLASPGTIQAFAVTRSWNAGAGQTDFVTGCDGRTAEADEATWNRTGQDGASWQQPGALGNPADCDAEPLGATVLDPAQADGHWISLDVTEAAQRWVADPASNHGLLLRAAPDMQGFARFYSAEAFRTQPGVDGGGIRVAWRPTLVVMP